MVLTEQELHEIECRLKAATLGPYKIGKTGGCIISDYPIKNCLMVGDELNYYGGHLIAESITLDNSVFLASAWQDIKNMLETIRTERRER